MVMYSDLLYEVISHNSVSQGVAGHAKYDMSIADVTFFLRLVR